MAGGTLKRYSLSKQVSDKLEAMIESGQYKVNEKIPSEGELMEYFGVSRNTLREAIQSLILGGVLEAKQGDGTYVRTNSRFHANMSSKLSQSSIKGIEEVRKTLQSSIIELACTRRTEEDLQVIFDAFYRRQALADANQAFGDADFAFHMAIAKSCHNDIMYELYLSFATHLRQHISEQRADMGVDQDWIDQLHQELLEAIQERDVQKAQKASDNIMQL